MTEAGQVISMEGNQYTYFKIDYCSNKIFVGFFEKNQRFQKTGYFLNKLEKERKELLKYIRLNGSTENKKFRELVEKIYPTIEFEFTAIDTPQQNGKMEKGIVLI